MFKLKGTNKAFTTDEDVREIFINMISESALELRESGSALYDEMKIYDKFVNVSASQEDCE